MYTNGTLLTIDRLNRIIQYLDTLYIDNYNDLHCLNSGIENVIQHLNENPLLAGKVEVNIIRPSAIRTTRGGTAPNRTGVFFLRSSCIYPFSQLNIQSDGKVILYCNDPPEKKISGDLNQETLVDVWYKEKYQNFRKTIARGRQNHPVCRNCDVFLIYPEFLYRMKRLVTHKCERGNLE